jgi:hypothetical protein
MRNRRAALRRVIARIVTATAIADVDAVARGRDRPIGAADALDPAVLGGIVPTRLRRIVGDIATIAIAGLLLEIIVTLRITTITGIVITALLHRMPIPTIAVLLLLIMVDHRVLRDDETAEREEEMKDLPVSVF